MNELLVMRHAKSDWTLGTSDFERPLNRRGERAADRVAEWLLDEQLCPDRILSSPAARARATAMAVAHACGTPAPAIEFDPDLYLAPAFTWMQKLTGRTEDRLLICGHNPGLDDLVERLASAPVEFAESGKLMTTAAVAHFRLDSWQDLDVGTADLVRLVRPADLENDRLD